MPYIIKTIGILGTIAMLAVGGGIIAHETHILQSLENIIKAIPLGGFFSEIILGAIVGYIDKSNIYHFNLFISSSSSFKLWIFSIFFCSSLNF